MSNQVPQLAKPPYVRSEVLRYAVKANLRAATLEGSPVLKHIMIGEQVRRYQAMYLLRMVELGY